MIKAHLFVATLLSTEEVKHKFLTILKTIFVARAEKVLVTNKCYLFSPSNEKYRQQLKMLFPYVQKHIIALHHDDKIFVISPIVIVLLRLQNEEKKGIRFILQVHYKDVN